ncbi:hypothetical protein PR202_gb23683 [Eleusine coracana subsp. coracana]|uniref:Uncharacterized protein n=1 Tax=Eleusine coracana subsp. coracana TaxID=191504 RepID=A0AAV5FL32_ELECO|nr:hypothetical protein PR202_gb23683 [Eleusine coracana subsp. coracana]
MSSAGGEGSSQSRKGKEREEDGAGGSSHQEEGVQVLEVDLGDLYGSAAGWVEARTSCPHLSSMPADGADDLARVPPPDSPCSRFGSSTLEFPAVPFRVVLSTNICCCIIKKQQLCKIRILMLHLLDIIRLLMLSILYMMLCSDLSVWCFACDSYLDVQAILELRPVYEVAHLLKFRERPPFRSLDVLDLSCGESGSSSSRA